MKNIIAIVFVLWISPALAENSDNSWWDFWKGVDTTSGASERLFTPEEKQIITSYFEQSYDENKSNAGDVAEGKKNKNKHKGKKKSLPPGLQKKVDRGGQLPPGWQKKVARGEVLDGELYSTSYSLPYGLSNRLPQQPAGTELRRIGDDIVRLQNATREILDVFKVTTSSH